MTSHPPRLSGLDFARFLAFAGMVIVNFNVVTEASADSGLLGFFALSVEGRAAATFVVLAGIGLGLGAARGNNSNLTFLTVKRSAFLMVIGLLNMLVFDADIIHYYAVYFLFALLFLQAQNRTIILAIAGLMILATAMQIGLDYDKGWNWETYAYADFWTLPGFVRNMFYNGWHPVIPWLGFFLFGMLLAQLPLAQNKTQIGLLVGGGVVWALAEISSNILTKIFADDPDMVFMLQTAPVPAVPLYLFAGAGAACVVIGLCLLANRAVERSGFLALLAKTGRQTLTLYFAHIFIGMSILEALGMLSGPLLWQSMLAAGLFILGSVIYVWAYSKQFKRGPLEALMRLTTG